MLEDHQQAMRTLAEKAAMQPYPGTVMTPNIRTPSQSSSSTPPHRFTRMRMRWFVSEHFMFCLTL
jgi:hypothetical protein